MKIRKRVICTSYIFLALFSASAFADPQYHVVNIGGRTWHIPIEHTHPNGNGMQAYSDNSENSKLYSKESLEQCLGNVLGEANFEAEGQTQKEIKVIHSNRSLAELSYNDQFSYIDTNSDGLIDINEFTEYESLTNRVEKAIKICLLTLKKPSGKLLSSDKHLH